MLSSQNTKTGYLKEEEKEDKKKKKRGGGGLRWGGGGGKKKICNEMFSIILKYTIGHSCGRKPVLLCETSGNYPPLPPPLCSIFFFLSE